MSTSSEDAKKMWERIEYLKKHPSKETKPVELEEKTIDQAVKLISETGNPSMEMVQKKLGLNFNETRILFDVLEERGILGKFKEDGKPREILVNSQDSSPEKGVSNSNRNLVPLVVGIIIALGFVFIIYHFLPFGMALAITGGCLGTLSLDKDPKDKITRWVGIGGSWLVPVGVIVAFIQSGWLIGLLSIPAGFTAYSMAKNRR